LSLQSLLLIGRDLNLIHPILVQKARKNAVHDRTHRHARRS